MTKSICFLNQKGGVGKTTLANNTAYILSQIHQKRVLLVDLDQQGNLSEIYTEDKNKEPSVGAIFREKSLDIKNIIQKAILNKKDIKNLDIIHSNLSLSQSLKELHTRTYKEKILTKAIQSIVVNYDYIILDCPASIEDSVINAVYFSKNFVIPIEMGGFAASAIQDVLELITEVKECNSLKNLLETKCVHFVKNRVDKRGILLNKKIDENIKLILPFTLKSYIRQSITISKATTDGLPIIKYKGAPSVVKNDYMCYINELLVRLC